MNRCIIVLTLVLLSACASQPTYLSKSLLNQLQHGGLVIFIRPTATNTSQKDTDLSNLENCQTQRNLSTKGREQSRLIGRQINQLDIPVGEVNTSFMCRCIDTAKLAFGKVATKMELTLYSSKDTTTKNSRSIAIREMLNKVPVEGTNTVIVSHNQLLFAATGTRIDEGEAVIYKPDSRKDSILIGRVAADAWNRLPIKR